MSDDLRTIFSTPQSQRTAQCTAQYVPLLPDRLHIVEWL
jgi:hypothetical protein